MGLYALIMVVHALESTEKQFIKPWPSACLFVFMCCFKVKIVIILHKNHSTQNINKEVKTSHTAGYRREAFAQIWVETLWMVALLAVS